MFVYLLAFLLFFNNYIFSQDLPTSWDKDIPLHITSYVAEPSFSNLKNFRLRVLGINVNDNFEKAFRRLDKSIKNAPCHHLDGSPYERRNCSFDSSLITKIDTQFNQYESYIKSRNSRPYGNLVLFVTFDESRLINGKEAKAVYSIRLTKEKVFFDRVNSVYLELKNIQMIDNKIDIKYDIEISYQGHTKEEEQEILNWYRNKKMKLRKPKRTVSTYGMGYGCTYNL